MTHKNKIYLSFNKKTIEYGEGAPLIYMKQPPCFFIKIKNLLRCFK